MPATTIDTAQVLDHTIQRDDLDVSTVGKAVVAKLLPGTNISLSSTGADAGTGDVTINGPAGSGSLFIQNGAPASPPSKYLWIQTGLGAGTDMTFWIEDALP